MPCARSRSPVRAASARGLSTWRRRRGEQARTRLALAKVPSVDDGSPPELLQEMFDGENLHSVVGSPGHAFAANHDLALESHFFREGAKSSVIALRHTRLRLHLDADASADDEIELELRA